MSMKIIKINEVDAEKGLNIVLKTLFDEDVTQKERLVIGTARISPGTRVPAEGESVHDGDEYAIIFKGRSSIVSGGQEYQVSEGLASFIPAGEAHWSINESDTNCELIWMLVKP
jgi:quercetin dioxygenase-like cupin family protein